jgi:hypothetical protein
MKVIRVYQQQLYAVMMCCCMLQFVAAQPESLSELDRVEFRQGVTETTKIGLWNSLQTVIISGKIRSMDSEKVVMEVATAEGASAVKTFSADQLQRIWPDWQGDAVAQALALFDQQKYVEFQQALSKSDLTKTPDWQQLLILDKIIQVRQANNQLPMAGDSFVKLANQAVPPVFYAHAPLCWAVTADEITSSAQKWLEQDHEAAKLLGASWLLLGTESKKAKLVLQQLQSSKNLAIRQLAKTQLWRLVPANATMEQLPGWLKERDRLLPALQAGPTEFITDRLTRIGQHDLAIGLAIQSLALDPEDRFRHKRMLQSIGGTLQRQQRSEEAQKVSSWLKQLDGAN